jgi:hypothetical protein
VSPRCASGVRRTGRRRRPRKVDASFWGQRRSRCASSLQSRRKQWIGWMSFLLVAPRRP